MDPGKQLGDSLDIGKLPLKELDFIFTNQTFVGSLLIIC